MPATVVTSENMAEFIQTGKLEPSKEQLPPLRREVIQLKRTAPEQKAAADDSKKLDDQNKTEVKPPPTGAKPAELDEDGFSEAERAEYTAKVRKTMGEKHRRAKEAEEFAEFQRAERLKAEKRVAELEAELKGKAKEPEPTKAPAGKPKPEDFANVAEYTDALTDWKIDQREAAKAQKQQEAEESARQTKASETWQTRMAAVMEANPDFMPTVSAAFNESNSRVAKSVMTYIEESELGPQLLFRLATHADELATFRSLTAEKAIGFLGRLEAKLEAPKADPKPEPKPEPAPKNVSKAPAPIDTSRVLAEPVTKDPRDMNTQEYLAYKRSQRRARAR